MNEIVIKDLSFGYDRTDVLTNVNFNYSIEDFLCIIGPNGGGKSTLIKLILGILQPTKGSISVYGSLPKNVNHLLSYVPQLIPTNESFPITALEVVLMSLINESKFGFYSKENKNRALEFLKTVEMQDYANRKISELSGGQRQRIYIARALCAKSKIIILDEPTASIDLKGETEIYNLLKSINASGVGIVMISHDINIAINYATKIAYVNKELVMHNITNDHRESFLYHLLNHKDHFCDVELVLKECSCKKY